jgi:hypothetical protein
MFSRFRHELLDLEAEFNELFSWFVLRDDRQQLLVAQTMMSLCSDTALVQLYQLMSTRQLRQALPKQRSNITQSNAEEQLKRSEVAHILCILLCTCR